MYNLYYSFRCIKYYQFFIKILYLYSEKSGFEPPGVKHNIQQISRLTYSNFSFYLPLYKFLIVIIFTRIEVKYGIGIKLKRVVKYETEKLNVKRELIKNST